MLAILPAASTVLKAHHVRLVLTIIGLAGLLIESKSVIDTRLDTVQMTSLQTV